MFGLRGSITPGFPIGVIRWDESFKYRRERDDFNQADSEGRLSIEAGTDRVETQVWDWGESRGPFRNLPSMPIPIRTSGSCDRWVVEGKEAWNPIVPGRSVSNHPAAGRERQRRFGSVCFHGSVFGVHRAPARRSASIQRPKSV